MTTHSSHPARAITNPVRPPSGYAPPAPAPAPPDGAPLSQSFAEDSFPRFKGLGFRV